MSIALGALLGAGVGIAGANAAFGNASHAVNSIQDYFFGGKSEKRSNERTQAMTLKQMMNEAMMQRDVYIPMQKSLYDWQSNFDYNMARRYGENSASWMVKGLRNANLNPILAATDGNFRSTYGSGGSMPDVSSGSSGSVVRSAGGHWASPAGSVDLASNIANLSSARSSMINAETASATQPYMVDTAKNQAFNSYAQGDITLATAAKIRAEADQIRANTAKSLVSMDNDIDHGDVHSWPQMLSAALRAFVPDLRTYHLRGTVHDIVGDSFDKHSAKEPTLDDVRKDYFSADRLVPKEGGFSRTFEPDTPSVPVSRPHSKRFRSTFLAR